MKSTAVISAATEGICDGYYDAGNYSVKNVVKELLKYANLEGLTAVLIRS